MPQVILRTRIDKNTRNNNIDSCRIVVAQIEQYARTPPQTTFKAKTDKNILFLFHDKDLRRTNSN